MSQNERDLVQNILDASEQIFSSIPVVIPQEWFSSDLTVAQLRILLYLQMNGSARMSAIASGLDITLPTATGIVDNLVKKDLVTRETNTQDRRLVICTLSATGRMFISRIWVHGQSQMERLLDGLTREQLEKCAEVAQILLDNARRQSLVTTGDTQ